MHAYVYLLGKVQYMHNLLTYLDLQPLPSLAFKSFPSWPSKMMCDDAKLIKQLQRNNQQHKIILTDKAVSSVGK